MDDTLNEFFFIIFSRDYSNSKSFDEWEIPYISILQNIVTIHANTKLSSCP